MLARLAALVVVLAAAFAAAARRPDGSRARPQLWRDYPAEAAHHAEAAERYVLALAAFEAARRPDELDAAEEALRRVEEFRLAERLAGGGPGAPAPGRRRRVPALLRRRAAAPARVCREARIASGHSRAERER